METVGRLDDGRYIVILSSSEYASRVGSETVQEPGPWQHWERTEVGKIFAKTKGQLGGSKGAYLKYFYVFCQFPSVFHQGHMRREFDNLDFVFDGTIASYKAIRPRLCEVYGIGPKLAAVYDEIILTDA